MKPFTSDIVIIGAGISGLSTAYYLLQKNPNMDIAILEASGRSGGVIQTHKVQGCLLDGGPDSFITSKPWATDLCKELGLEDQFIAPNPNYRGVFAVYNNELKKLTHGSILGIPTDIWGFLRNSTFSWKLKFQILQDLMYRPQHHSNQQDESIHDFLQRHFGAQAVDLILEPILAGIYAGRAKDLSINATFPQLVALEQKNGSLIRALAKSRNKAKGSQKSIFLTLKSGLGSLIEKIVEKLPDQIFHYHCPVTKIDYLHQEKKFEIQCNNEMVWNCKHCVVALPTTAAKKILTPLSEVYQGLDSFKSVSTATVFLAFLKSDLPAESLKKYRGLGFIVPRNETTQLLAGTWISQKFAHRSPDDIFLIRCFWGGSGRETVTDLPEDQLVEMTQTEMQRLMGINGAPIFSKVFIWNKLSPQYNVGHLGRLENLENATQKYPHLHLIGNSYRGTGIPDCIRQAKECSDQLIQGQAGTPEY